MDHDLEDEEYSASLPLTRKRVQDIIKNNYERLDYRSEAQLSQLHDTPFRQKIIEENDKILQNGCYILRWRVLSWKGLGSIETKVSK